MDVQDLVKNFRALFEGSVTSVPPQPDYPEVAVEITPDRVTAARVTRERRTGRLLLNGVETTTLPAGCIEPSLVKPNILAPEPVTHAIEAVLSKVGAGGQRISLLLPDHVARVAILGFSTLPRTRRELADLVRFRMTKSLPFKPQDASMDFMVLGSGGGTVTASSAFSVMAVFMHRAVLEQYEGLLVSAGLWPGLVGLTTIELYNLFRPRFDKLKGAGKDALLMNVTNHEMTLLVFKDEDLIFYRCKQHPPGSETDETVAALRREIYTSLAFYQEKLLGRGIGRIFLRGSGIPVETVREVAVGEAECAVEVLDLEGRLPLAEGVTVGPEAMAVAAPVVGAVVGRRT